MAARPADTAAIQAIPDEIALVPPDDLRLRRPSVPVDRVTPDVRRLVTLLCDLMRREHGVGLAAPQAGVLLRVIVVDVSPYQPGTQPLALINPVVTRRSGSATALEACLSLPGIEAPVRRARDVRVAAVDRHGAPVTIDATGLLARALQHEIDHLDGVLFIDRASWAHRRRLRHALTRFTAAAPAAVPAGVAATAL